MDRARRRARGKEPRPRERGPGKSREMRLTHICCCCLLYQLGVLSNGIVSGKFSRDFELCFLTPPAETETARGGRAGAAGARRAGGSVGSNKEERAGADERVTLASEVHFSRPHFKHPGMARLPLRVEIFAKVRLQHLGENGGVQKLIATLCSDIYLIIYLCWSLCTGFPSATKRCHQTLLPHSFTPPLPPPPYHRTFILKMLGSVI